MPLNEITPGNKEHQNTKFDVLGFTQIPNGSIQKDSVINLFRKYARTISIDIKGIEGLLDSELQVNNINYNDIFAVSATKQGTITLYLNDRTTLKIETKSLQKKPIANDEKTEAKMKNILGAMEYIFTENDSWYGSELDHSDRIDTDKFGSELVGMNVTELKALLELEKGKLSNIYHLRGTTDTQLDMLETELQMYVGIGDKYEGGARHFDLDEKKLDTMTNELVSKKSIPEIFVYLQKIHNDIDDNDRQSANVKLSYNRYLNRLYSLILYKLEKTEASNIDVLNFAKIITGRDIVMDGKKLKTNIDTDYESAEMANKALLYVMHRKNGVLDSITQDIVVEDEEIKGRSPSSIMRNISGKISALSSGQTGFVDRTLKELHAEHLIGINQSYDRLSFQDKITIGTLARIIDKIDGLTTVEKQQPNLINHLSKTLVSEAFEEVNDSFSDNFDSNWADWNGKNAHDLGLYGDMGEIFTLYQDINGNNGLLHLSDNSMNNGEAVGRFGVMLSVAILTAVVVLSSVPMATAGFGSLFIAGAAIGGVASLAGIAMDSTGYDSLGEGVVDVVSEVTLDALMGGLAFGVLIKLLRKLGLAINPAIFSLAKESHIDKVVIGAEIGAGMVGQGVRGALIQQGFTQNHSQFRKQLDN